MKMVSFFIKRWSNKWFSDNFNNEGIYQNTSKLLESEILNIESQFSIDIDKDGELEIKLMFS